MTQQHPVIHGFMKWFAVNIILIMVIWYPGPLQKFAFIKTLVNNFGSTYYDFFFFWWFVMLMGSFLGLVVWPSLSKKSYLR